MTTPATSQYLLRKAYDELLRLHNSEESDRPDPDILEEISDFFLNE